MQSFPFNIGKEISKETDIDTSKTNHEKKLLFFSNTKAVFGDNNTDRSELDIETEKKLVIYDNRRVFSSNLPSSCFHRFDRLSNYSDSLNDITNTFSQKGQINNIAANTKTYSTSNTLNCEWMELSIVYSNGGQFSEQYSLNNILLDDDTVYCSKKNCSVDIILQHQANIPFFAPVSFTIEEIHIRAPKTGYTSPLRNGFFFACSEKPSPRLFEAYNQIETANLLDLACIQKDHSLPPVPSMVKSILYFHMDDCGKRPFSYKFKEHIREIRYIYLKFLDSFDRHYNIDVEFVGIKGQISKLSFSNADLK